MYPEAHWGSHPGQRFSYELGDRSAAGGVAFSRLSGWPGLWAGTGRSAHGALVPPATFRSPGAGLVRRR